ncbi:MAG: hypothetical protein RIA71_14320 [Oceanicaulis sp.]
MIVTYLVMSDERPTMAQFPPRYGLSFESRLDALWRLGDIIPVGKPFPVLVERGSHPTKHQIPVKGFEAQSDQAWKSDAKLARALIPVNGIGLKPSGDIGLDSRELRTERRDECAFIVAFAECGSRPSLYTSVTGIQAPSVGRDGEWISWEPMVVYDHQAAKWLLGKLDVHELAVENARMSERLVPREQR